MAEQDQWRAGKALAQLFGEIDPVGNKFFTRYAGRAVLCERSPCPALVPLHEDKVALVGCVSRDERRLNVTRPAVQEQQHWISPIVAADRDPLFNPANRDERGLFDALGRCLCVQGYGGKKQKGETRRGMSHAVYDGTRAALVDSSSHLTHPPDHLTHPPFLAPPGAHQPPSVPYNLQSDRSSAASAAR